MMVAKEIAFNYLKEQIISVQPIIGKGFVNKVFIVKTSNSKIVIRMNDDPEYVKEYQKEQWCMEQASSIGIPGAKVLEVGLHRKIAYMILNFIDGDHGEDSSIDKNHIWRMIGKCTRQLHSINVTGFGEMLTDPGQGHFQSPPHDNFDGTWPSFIKYNVDSLTESDELIKLGVLSQRESELVKQLFVNLNEIPFTFGLNHGDLSLKNSIVTKDGLVSIIDWGNAEVDIVPHGEIIKVLRCKIESNNPDNMEFTSFLEGYGLSQSDYMTIKKDLHTLLLLRAFDKLRWAIDCNPQEIDSFAEYAKRIKNYVLYE